MILKLTLNIVRGLIYVLEWYRKSKSPLEQRLISLPFHGSLRT